MNYHNKSLGAYGEKIACDFLKENHFIVLKKNYCTYWGEIDIIAEKDHCLHFVEVKTRKSLHYGAPELAVTAKKQEVIKKCALSFIQADGDRFQSFCFDVIAIFITSDYQSKIRFIENAFT